VLFNNLQRSSKAFWTGCLRCVEAFNICIYWRSYFWKTTSQHTDLPYNSTINRRYS